MHIYLRSLRLFLMADKRRRIALRGGMRISSVGVVCVLTTFCPIMDNINGIFLLNGQNTNVSSAYKSFIMFLCLLFLIIDGRLKKSTAVNFVTMGGLLFLSNLSFFIRDKSGLSYNLNTTFKLLMPFTVYIFFSDSKGNGGIKVKKILDFYSWFYPLSLIIPMMLGIGFQTYSEVGNKGFYYAGNEISAIMVIMFAYSFQRWSSSKEKKHLRKLAANVLAILFVGTKSAYAALGILCIIVFLSKVKSKKHIVSILVGTVFAVATTYFIYTKNRDFFAQLVQVWVWKYETFIKGKYENELIAFLLSGRNSKLWEAFHLLKEDLGISEILLGVGSYSLTSRNYMLIEMDFFDLFFWYGSIFTIILSYKLFRKACKIWTILSLGEKTFVILIFSISFLGGHVLFAPSVSLVMALYIYETENRILWKWQQR